MSDIDETNANDFKLTTPEESEMTPEEFKARNNWMTLDIKDLDNVIRVIRQHLNEANVAMVDIMTDGKGYTNLEKALYALIGDLFDGRLDFFFKENADAYASDFSSLKTLPSTIAAMPEERRKKYIEVGKYWVALQLLKDNLDIIKKLAADMVQTKSAEKVHKLMGTMIIFSKNGYSTSFYDDTVKTVKSASDVLCMNVGDMVSRSAIKQAPDFDDDDAIKTRSKEYEDQIRSKLGGKLDFDDGFIYKDNFYAKIAAIDKIISEVRNINLDAAVTLLKYNIDECNRIKDPGGYDNCPECAALAHEVLSLSQTIIDFSQKGIDVAGGFKKGSKEAPYCYFIPISEIDCPARGKYEIRTNSYDDLFDSLISNLYAHNSEYMTR